MNYEAIVEGVEKLKRGIVWCTLCGRMKRTNSARNLQHGWPECCNFTMTLDSPEERAASKPKPTPTEE